MSSVAASLVVSFGSGASSDALVVLELDNDLNDDATSFAPGDDIFFRLHHDSTVQIANMKATDGMVDAQGTGSRTITTELLFAESADEHELSYLPSGGLTVGYFGNVATNLKKSGSRKVVIDGGVLPALAQVDYSADFSLYRLIAPTVTLADDESYPVVIVAYMEAAA